MFPPKWIAFFLIASLCFGDSEIPEVKYPALARTGKSSQDFLPAGWKTECEQTADISRDGIADLVLVLRQNDPGNVMVERDGMGPDTLDTNPRILAVALGLPGSGGYRLVTQNHALIPRHVERNLEDWMGECPEIKRGALNVTLALFASAGTWSSWNSTFVLRYQDSCLRLIGWEYHEVTRNSGESKSKSINFLTGRMESEVGNISDKKSSPSIAKIPKDSIISIDAIGDGSEFAGSEPEEKLKEALPKGDPLLFVGRVGGRWFAAGNMSSILTPDGKAKVTNGSYELSAIMASADGLSWTRMATGMGDDIRAIVRTRHGFFALGSQVLTSPDGVTWTIKPSPENYPGASVSALSLGDMLVLAWGNGQGGILTSLDGAQWTRRWESGDHALYSIAWSGTQLVAVGFKGAVITSPDGIKWTTRELKHEEYLNSVAWAGHQFVAVGYSGVILTSPNGISWTKRKSGTWNELSAVAWTGKTLVAVGSEGTILTSPDGIRWTRKHLDTFENFKSAAWGEATEGGAGALFAVSDFGAIWSSPDGIAWTKKYQGKQPVFPKE